MDISKKKFISIFTGAMGLDLGLEKTKRLRAIACVEKDHTCCDTIRANQKAGRLRRDLKIFEDDISSLDPKFVMEAFGLFPGDLDLLVGGPPCQSFSVFGNRKGVEDQRGKLIYEFIRFVSEIQPKLFLMENVRGLHSMSIVPKKALSKYSDILPEKCVRGSLLRDIISRFEKVGYRVDCFLVNSVNYGAPQIRERLICIGNRFNIVANFPEPQFSNRHEDKLPPFRTLKDVIGEDFKDQDPSVMDFSPRKLKYLSMVPPGGNWRSLPVEIQKESMGKTWYLKGGRSAYWRKLSFDFPSPTVVTMPNHAGTSMCHPREVRALTVGECAAVQEFPIDWIFKGTTADKYRQIGNAVPVRLGFVAGQVVVNLLEEIENKGKRQRTNKKTIASIVKHIRPHVRTRSFYRNGRALAGNHCYYLKHSEKHNDMPLLSQSK